MATTAQAPRVDAGALAGAIKAEVTDRLGTVLTSAFDAFDDDENGLNQIQKSVLIDWTIETFDGFERAVAIKIVEALTCSGVEVWGFSDPLSDLLPNEGVKVVSHDG